MLRLAIVLPVYAFVAIFLPRQPDVARVLEPMLALDPNIAIRISFAALAGSVLLIWLMRREPNGWLLTNPAPWLHVAFMGLIGLAFAGVFDVFEWMSGAPTSVISLIVIPIAFTVAEAVYLALQWRMNRKFD